MPFITTAAIVGGTLAAGIGGAAISAHAAGKAADAQSEAAMNAAQLQRQSEKEALAYTKEKDALAQKNFAPWLSAGTTAINDLSGQLQHGGFPDWTGQFQAPTGATEQNDPGYQFRLQQGTNAIEASAAARGNLFTGGTGKALTRFGQDYASNEYGNVYNRALNDYSLGYNQFKQNQADRFNRYSAISGTGQVAAGQLGVLGQNSANNVGNILMSSAQMQGNALQQAAAARASGYVGSANQWSGMLQGIPGLLMQQSYA
jgi:hypothetical protein